MAKSSFVAEATFRIEMALVDGSYSFLIGWTFVTLIFAKWD